MLFVDVSLIAYNLLMLFKSKDLCVLVSKPLTSKCNKPKREDHSTSSLKLIVGCKIQASS
jgi:hypothetical protein